MIHFECGHCGRGFKAPETDAGKAGRCPQCGNKVVVPPAPTEKLTLVREPNATPAQKPLEPDAAPPSGWIDSSHRAQEAETRRRDQEVLESLGPLPVPERTGERQFFWLFDILVYPFSGTGLVTLGVIIGFPLVRALLGAVIPPFMPYRGFLFLIIGSVLTLYLGWYLAECVYDSAKGGTRAPDVMDADTSLGSLWSRVSYLLAVYLIYGLPVLIYVLIMQRFDAIFWALAAWAVLLFPMGLLAMVINDSVSALNPFFLVGSIFRVFLPYLGLVACLIGMACLLILLPALFRPAPPAEAIGAFGLASLVLGAYGSFLFAHVLGRFYWRHRDRLDWGI